MPSNNYNVCHYISQRVIFFILNRLAVALSVLRDILLHQLSCGLAGDFLKVGTADPEHRCVVVAADVIIIALLEKAIAVRGARRCYHELVVAVCRRVLFSVLDQQRGKCRGQFFDFLLDNFAFTLHQLPEFSLFFDVEIGSLKPDDVTLRLQQ